MNKQQAVQVKKAIDAHVDILLNEKLINDAVFVKKARYTKAEIEKLNLTPERKERMLAEAIG